MKSDNHFDVTGFDIDSTRINELRSGNDRTREAIFSHALDGNRLRLTDVPDDCRGADVYIITVPIPVDKQCRPDLGAVMGSTHWIIDQADASNEGAFRGSRDRK